MSAQEKKGRTLAPPLIEYFQSVTLVMWLKQDSHEVAGQSKHGSSATSEVESLQLNAVNVNSSKLSHKRSFRGDLHIWERHHLKFMAHQG